MRACLNYGKIYEDPVHQRRIYEKGWEPHTARHVGTFPGRKGLKDKEIRSRIKGLIQKDLNIIRGSLKNGS